MTPDNSGQNGRPGSPEGELWAALFGLCPKCGSKTLFSGIASFSSRCRVCGLDYSVFNVGDGPAAFLTLIIGALVTGLALWLELSWHPPFWLHIFLWIPLTALAVTFGLRVSKAWLLQAEYLRKAKEATGKDVGAPNKGQDEA